MKSGIEMKRYQLHFLKASIYHNLAAATETHGFSCIFLHKNALFESELDWRFKVTGKQYFEYQDESPWIAPFGAFRESGFRWHNHPTRQTYHIFLNKHESIGWDVDGANHRYSYRETRIGMSRQITTKKHFLEASDNLQLDAKNVFLFNTINSKSGMILIEILTHKIKPVGSEKYAFENWEESLNIAFLVVFGLSDIWKKDLD